LNSHAAAQFPINGYSTIDGKGHFSFKKVYIPLLIMALKKRNNAFIYVAWGQLLFGNGGFVAYSPI
jgi:hypothetical protein